MAMPPEGEVRSRSLNRWHWLWWCLAAVAGALATIHFYSGFLLTGFTNLQGDLGDGLLTLVISRHWPLLPESGLGWNEIGIFYPAADTLGYSDTLLLNGSLESLFEAAGISSLFWAQLTLICFTLLGYGCAIAFLRIGPRVPWLITIPAALVLVFGSGLYAASNHPQLLTLQLLPAFALLALLSFRSRSRPLSWLIGLVAGLVLGLITYSAFYVGYFALIGIAMVLVLTVALVWLGPQGRSGLQPLVRSGWTILVGFGLSLVLFTYTYGPAIASGSKRAVSEVAAFSVEPQGLFAIGSDNWLWAKLLGLSVFGAGFGEAPMAPTPLLLALSLGLFCWGLWRLRTLSTWGRLGMSCVVAGAILWLAPVKVGNFFPWEWTFYQLPGGSVIRAVGRIELMAAALLVLGVALLLGAWWVVRPKVGVAAGAVVAALMVLLVVEQINLADKQGMDVAMLQDLERISPPPAGCQSFALTSTNDPKATDAFSMIFATTQASFIAQNVNVPTWNGYSGQEPEGWALLMVNGPNYRQSAKTWGERYGLLPSACGLDLATKSWLNPQEFNTYLGQ